MCFLKILNSFLVKPGSTSCEAVHGRSKPGPKGALRQDVKWDLGSLPGWDVVHSDHADYLFISGHETCPELMGTDYIAAVKCSVAPLTYIRKLLVSVTLLPWSCGENQVKRLVKCSFLCVLPCFLWGLLDHLPGGRVFTCRSALIWADHSRMFSDPCMCSVFCLVVLIVSTLTYILSIWVSGYAGS